MSEPAAKPRQPIDLEEFERRLRAGTPAAQSGQDPLTELAQLVGQNDPFQAASGQSSYRAAPGAKVAEDRDDSLYAKHGHPPLHDDWSEQGDVFAGEDQRTRSDADWHGAHHGHFDEGSEPEPNNVPADEEAYAFETTEYEEPGSHFAQEHGHHEDANGAVFADDAIPPPAFFEPDAPPRRSLRGVVLLVAILIAAAAGSWAALRMKGTLVAQSDKQPPVILAGGPTKIQPDSPGGVQPPSQAAAVLDKTAVDKPAQARVVSNEEQPVDLSQQDATQVPSATPPTAASPQVSPGASVSTPAPAFHTNVTASPAPAGTESSAGFPEPKRVKVVSVRPDGSIIGSDTESAASAMAAVPPTAISPAASNVAAATSAPKMAARALGSATAALADPATDSSDPAAPMPKPRPADPKAAAKALAKPKPAQVAEADAGPDTTATTTASGPFAVQLAAAPSEQDARETLQRVQKKFSTQLGHHKTTFHKVQVGDKMVYRVRVGNLSHDEATDLCNKLQSDGGSCFVASQN